MDNEATRFTERRASWAMAGSGTAGPPCPIRTPRLRYAGGVDCQAQALPDAPKPLRPHHGAASLLTPPAATRSALVPVLGCVE